MARDERGGLAVRLVRGSGSFRSSHNLLEARALIEAVGPKRLHFTVAQLRPLRVPRPCARRTRSTAGVPGGGSRRPGAAAPLGLAGVLPARR